MKVRFRWRYLEQGKRYGLYDKKHTIMELVKIDYLVENTFREKPVLQKKRITYLFFFIGCCSI
jgi:hypothetical protein